MAVVKKLLLIILFLPLMAYSQKLPSKQLTGLYIPANSKIDGKPTEWDGKFQAYNSSTDVFYTIANDDKNLYVIIKASDQLVIRKIIAGSIVISINTSENKNSKDAVAMTYPIFEKDNLPNVNLKNKPVFTKDTITGKRQLDSFMYVANKEIVKKSKEIKILRGHGLKDTLISVYNEYGIKVASGFDNKISYTCEMLIPFKYLGFSPNQIKIFYNISLPGSDHAEGSSIENIPGGVRVNGTGLMADMQFIWASTDFSGEYILAKK